MSKAPDPGQVKTRLIPAIGAAAAAELYRDLLCATLEMVVDSGLCTVELWCSPSMTHPFFQECAQQFGVELHEQPPGDLGRRMSYALESSSKTSQAQLLIGADCPTLSADDLEEALILLQQDTELVLGPAEDGGYYLIGMREFYPFVFDDIPWSTSAVLALTKNRLNTERIKWRSLTLRRDLDTADDYRAYLESARDTRNVCRTRG